MHNNPWTLLDIATGSDARTIKKAYARLLKQTRPEDDPEGFQRLRAAYEYALQTASMPGTDNITVELNDPITSNHEESSEDQSNSTAVNEQTEATHLHSTLQTHDTTIDLQQQNEQLPNQGEFSTYSAKERAETVFRDILLTLSQDGEIAARQTLFETLQSDELYDLELRKHFENALIEWLYSQDEPSLYLICGAYDELLWGDPNHMMAQLHPGLLQLAQQAKTAYSVLDTLQSIKEGSYQHFARFKSSEKYLGKAANLLLTNDKNSRDWRVAFNSKLSAALSELLKPIGSIDNYAFQKILPCENLDYWANTIERRPSRGWLLMTAIPMFYYVSFPNIITVLFPDNLGLSILFVSLILLITMPVLYRSIMEVTKWDKRVHAAYREFTNRISDKIFKDNRALWTACGCLAVLCLISILFSGSLWTLPTTITAILLLSFGTKNLLELLLLALPSYLLCILCAAVFISLNKHLEVSDMWLIGAAWTPTISGLMLLLHRMGAADDTSYE